MVGEMSFEGGRDLERALDQIARLGTRRSLARRVLKKAAKPLADQTNANAPTDVDGEEGRAKLNESYVVTSRLSKRQARLERKGDRDDVVMFVGTSHPAGVQQEFGNRRHAAQPHFRPAWDADKEAMLQRIRADLAIEIEKTVARAARRAAQSGT